MLFSLQLLHLVFLCDIVNVSSEIKNICVRHKALRLRHRDYVPDRVAHALKQLAITKHFTADTKPREKKNPYISVSLQHTREIFYLVYIIVFYFRIYIFFMTEYV